MKDGDIDFSNYTSEQIERSLSRVNREKYPLNYARLLAAQNVLPPVRNPVQLQAAREAELLDSILTGAVWLSSPWTLVTNALCGLVPGLVLIWLATKLASTSASPSLGPAAVTVFIVGFLVVLSVRFLTLERAVVRDDKLEIRGLGRCQRVLLTHIDRVRWNDAQDFGSRHLAVIEMRVEAGKTLRVSILPHSIPIMRAFAAHVGAIQRRADVADPAYVSNFYIGGSDS